MTAPDSSHQRPMTGASADFERLAMGHAIRRSVAFGGWWYGTVLLWGGLAHLAASAALGLPIYVGCVLMGVGGLLSGLGWLATSGLRFSRKLPAPVLDLRRAKELDRSNVPAAWITVISALLICAAILMFSGRPVPAELVAIVAALFTVAVSVAAGFLITARIYSRRQANYARWLATRFR